MAISRGSFTDIDESRLPGAQGGGGNPFATLSRLAQGGVSGAGGGIVRPATAQAPQGNFGPPSSRFYSGILDPDRGMLRGLGQLLGSPTRQQYEAEQFGGALQGASTYIQGKISAGMPPQRAILDFIGSDQGQQFFASGGDMAQLGKIAQLGLPDPSAEIKARRKQLYQEAGGQDTKEVYIKLARRLLEEGDMEGYDGAVKILGSLEVEKQTADIQEYEYAKRQGYAGTFEDWQKTKPSGTTVNVNTGVQPDAKLRESLDKATGDLWAEYQKAGAASAAAAQDMGVLQELVKMAPQSPLTGPLLQMFPGLSSSGAAFQSVIKRLAPTLRAPGSGSTSDIEYQGMLDSLPSLSNRPEANTAILEIIRSKAAINLERSEIIDAFAAGEISAAEARKQMGALDRKSIMTPQLKAAIGGLGGPAAKGGKSVRDMSDEELEAIINGN